ncbi:MAG: hypothetical protein PVH82_05990 [Desulfobacteraceae bacterium]
MKEIKDHVLEALTRVGETTELTPGQVHQIMREAMATKTKGVKGDKEGLRRITGGAIKASVEELEKGGKATEAMIASAVDGVVEGVKKGLQDEVEALEAQMKQIKVRLREEEKKKSLDLHAALEGASESTEAFTGEVKELVEDAVVDAKLKNALILGLTRETVKEAVKQAIEIGKDVEETVTNITRDATLKALAEARFSAEKVKEVSNIVLSGATEAAEETGSYVREVAQGAVRGSREGVMRAARRVKEDVSEKGEKAEKHIREDVTKTKEDLEAAQEVFLETLNRLSRRVSDVTGEVFTNLAKKSREVSWGAKEEAGQIREYATGRIKELGKGSLDRTAQATGKAVQGLAEEAKELGKRSMYIAKGAISGLLKGAKDGLKKGEEASSGQTPERGEKTLGMKEAYQNKMEARLEEWKAEIDKLKAKAEKAEAEAQLEYFKQIEKLRAKQEVANEKLRALMQASDDSWQDLKAGMESAWIDLSESVKSAISRFK